MKPIAIWTLVISGLMIASFILSGVYFFNSGLFDFYEGSVTEEKALVLMIQFENFYSDKFGHGSITIEDETRYETHCKNDSECSWFSSLCGDCNQIPINTKYESQYKNAVDEACKDINFIACDMIIHDVKCIDNRCRLDDGSYNKTKDYVVIIH